MTKGNELPKASVADTASFVQKVVIPVLAKGPIIRRPQAVGKAERRGLDTRAIQTVQALEEKYGPGPLLLRLPVRRHAIILSPADARRVLDNSPEPFATASKEKYAALAHFEPRNSLVSHGPERTLRRKFNEQALESSNTCHHMAESFLAVVHEEAAELLKQLKETSGSGSTAKARTLSWDDFLASWYRVVRRVVFGDHARDDHELISMIEELRGDANWAFLKPINTRLRDKFHERVKEHLNKAEPGSLAALIGQMREAEKALPWEQVPQWLFAFDPAGMASYRALALLATHAQQAEAARQEIAGDTSGGRELPYLRASVLESLRLWPTTPLILRETTTAVQWDTGIMPAKTHIVLFAPFFHRDARKLPYANEFTPQLWLEQRDDWPLMPFSDGPAICPGRHLVLMLTSTMIADLLRQHDFRLSEPERLRSGEPLPGILDNYSLEFKVTER